MIFIYDWYMLEKDILKCLLNIKKICFAKLYHKAPYILFELTVFFYLCYVGGGGSPPKKNPLIFSILTFPDSLMLP